MRKADNGGGSGSSRFLGTDGWLELASVNAVVAIRRIERMEDYVPKDRPKEAAEQIKCEVVCVASKGGKMTGRFWPDQNVISRAIVSRIGDPIEPDEASDVAGRQGAVDGEVVCARIVALGQTKKFPGANEPSDPEYDAAEKFYRDRGLDPSDPADDAKLFEMLHAEHAERNRAAVREQTSKLAGKGRPSSAAADEVDEDDDDDEPPF